MASNSQLPTPSGSLVGTISIWAGEDFGGFISPQPIYSRQEVYIGRDPKQCQYVLTDPLVSNKHLWIYTVLYDQDNPEEIEPLVYVQDVSMNGSGWNTYPMEKGRSYLLDDGDTLQLGDDICLMYNSAKSMEDLNSRPGRSYMETGFTVVQYEEMELFKDEYFISRRKLGCGAYGQVYMAYNEKTGKQFACKIVDLLAVKQQLARRGEARHQKAYDRPISPKLRESYVKFHFQSRLDRYHLEAKLLESLQHPNIVGLEKVIQSDNTMYMFQDLLSAGDLFSYVQYKGGRLPDIEAAVILRQIVIALDYLHSKNIIHRDLKPDNILMTSRADGCRVVLSDFGCAAALDPITKRVSSVVGTFDYTAPEVVKRDKKGYTKAADLWSLGCTAAILLTGEPLFSDLPRPREVSHRLEAIKKLKVRMERLKVGERAQDFVFRLLQHDPSKRMDVKEALQHSWFTNPSHKADFEALYNRSIKDWTPRTTIEPRIVGLESYARQRDSQNGQGSTESEPENRSRSGSESCSQRTPSTGEEGDDSDRARVHSETPSEVILVPDQKEVSDYFSRPPHNCGSYCPEPATRQAENTKEKAHLPSDIERVEDSYTASKALATPRSSDSLRMRAVVDSALSDAYSPGFRNTGYKRLHSDSGEVEIKEEVYEEVSNPFTGKRQQLAYGARV